MYFWVKFSDRPRGCIEAPDEATAIELAKQHGANPSIVGRLSYPASPQLVSTSGCPSFCYMPDRCAELGQCWPNTHRRRSCCS